MKPLRHRRRSLPNCRRRHRRAFTLVELLVVIAVIGVLASILVPVAGRARMAARTAVSLSNLRQLATATHAYITDNRGFFPPSVSYDNHTRWHGMRTGYGKPFDASKGWLGPYLGRDGRLKLCPQFEAMEKLTGGASFEDGAGGYGYNGDYLGPRPNDAKAPYRPTSFLRLPLPSRTVMFATTALAKPQGIQEYPFSDPPYHVENGVVSYALTPSTHFRFGGKALAAWCDGRVSTELPNRAAWPGPNAYGADNEKASVGWFGPTEANGYWNPHYPYLAP